MTPRKWPVAIALLFFSLLIWYLVYTNQIVGSLRSNAETLTQIYGEVQAGLSDPDPSAELVALTRLQRLIVDAGVPLVVTGPGGEVSAVENLPFDVDLSDPADQGLLQRYVAALDVQNPPVGDSTVQVIHFGDTPEVARLRWIPWLQAGGLALTVLLGLAVIRYQRRTAAEQAWTAMARELAHQLGTPISSLQGWVELLGLPERERPPGLSPGEIASNIEEDLIRLERISRRFELIGREPDLRSISLRVVVEDLKQYLQARLPRLGPGVDLRVDLPEDLPNVQGHEVLLAWALENVVKNALDAVAGTGGSISISARPAEGDRVSLRIHDTGPGVVPEVRDRLFEPGVTTKSGGWGVGLTLARRIVEGVHGGRIELMDRWERGTTFQVTLPRAPDQP